MQSGIDNKEKIQKPCFYFKVYNKNLKLNEDGSERINMTLQQYIGKKPEHIDPAIFVEISENEYLEIMSQIEEIGQKERIQKEFEEEQSREIIYEEEIKAL